MDVREIEEILGAFRLLKAPKHLLITDEPIKERVDGVILYRGVQPTYRGDVIVLSTHADETTPIHESIHAQLGLDEPATNTLTRLLHAKYRLLKNLPALKGLVSKPVRYVECHGCEEFKTLHTKYKGRVRHYIRKR